VANAKHDGYQEITIREIQSNYDHEILSNLIKIKTERFSRKYSGNGNKKS